MNVHYFILILCLTIIIQLCNCDKNYHQRHHNSRKYDVTTNNEHFTRKRRTNDGQPQQITDNSLIEDETHYHTDTHESDLDNISSYSRSSDEAGFHRGRFTKKSRRLHRYDDYVGSFESYELPLPPRKRLRYDYAAENRPLFNLLLGILDTFKTSTKQEIRRAEQRKRRQQSQMLIENFGDHVKNFTSMLLTPIDV